MYLVSLHGQVASTSVTSNGAPTECTAFTKLPRSSISRSAPVPIRVMIRIETAT